MKRTYLHFSCVISYTTLQKLLWTPFQRIPPSNTVVRLLSAYRGTPFTYRDGLSEWKGDGGLLFATRDEEIVGLLRLDYRRTYTELTSFAVSPSMQGKGIGQQMLDSVITAATLSHTPVYLKVKQDNPAQFLYSRNGFRRCAVSDGRYHMKFTSSSRTPCLFPRTLQ